MKFKKAFIKLFKRSVCRKRKHVFTGKDMGHRNEAGVLKWPCHRCGKVFEAEYGLKILENGTCTGEWS